MANRRKLCRDDSPWEDDGRRSCPSVASYLQFYTNIPDYNELHDLPDSEFYAKLQTLKETQSLLACEDQESDLGVGVSSESSMSSKPTGGGPRIVVDSPVSLESGSCASPPLHHIHGHRDLCRSMGALSLDSSGLHVHGEQYALRPHSRAASRVAKIERKHAVPVLSRIPLFHKIMAEQEERRKIIHERNSSELQSMIQPFSFTKREEAEKRLRQTCMTPGEVMDDCTRGHPNVSECARGGRSRSKTRFRARPVPRDLFSDRAYDRMRDDQFCRALRKRMRAEEMLKNARLPPSMEARVQSDQLKDHSGLICSKPRRQRSRCDVYRDIDSALANEVAGKWQESPTNQCRMNFAWKDLPANQLHQRNWRDSPYSQSRPSTAWNDVLINQSNSSSTDASPIESTLGASRKKKVNHVSKRRVRPSSSNISVSRSNLASLLRTQTARSRLERQLQYQIEDQHQREHARMKARLVRLSPAWRALDFSTDEDVSLRLAQRRHEAKQLSRKYRALMDDIQGRVHHIPPLFQQPGRTKIPGGKKEDNIMGKSLDSSLNTYDNPVVGLPAGRKARSFYVDRCCSNDI